MHPLTRYPLNVARHHAGRLELRRSKRSLTARPRWNDWEDHGGRVSNLPCMGLILPFRLNPSPRCLNHTDHGLPAGMNMHVLYHDPLLALAAMAIERVEQHREGAGEYSCHRRPWSLLFKASLKHPIAVS